MWPWSFWCGCSLGFGGTRCTHTNNYGIHRKENKPPDGAVNVNPISELNRFLGTSVWRHNDSVHTVNGQNLYVYEDTQLYLLWLFTSWSLLIAVTIKSVKVKVLAVSHLPTAPKSNPMFKKELMTFQPRVRFIVAVTVEPVVKCLIVRVPPCWCDQLSLLPLVPLGDTDPCVPFSDASKTKSRSGHQRDVCLQSLVRLPLCDAYSGIGVALLFADVKGLQMISRCRVSHVGGSLHPGALQTFGRVQSTRSSAATAEQETSSGMKQMKEQMIPPSPWMTCSSDPESVFASLASFRALLAKFSASNIFFSVRVCVLACVGPMISLTRLFKFPAACLTVAATTNTAETKHKEKDGRRH